MKVSRTTNPSCGDIGPIGTGPGGMINVALLPTKIRMCRRSCSSFSDQARSPDRYGSFCHANGAPGST
ncbi:hypothetical protein ONR75_29485 [Rhodopseudomonas sp. P2A-2r]|uniref:hypothetical protein n=1 Tax=Rhodopseudomonas sp. P2A-2r TaxID=2991972 RepID=UPI002234421B|nr:hypothetical protein [Rhodopseudomonas sp. P2A-2r]UZE48829.1 hypothetical protein ONR75_29485 [Rhodopseudomonas sp. P2A-2r]